MKPIKLTEEYYNLIVNTAKRFAKKNRVDADDVLSYLHEKIVPVLNRYDPSKGVPIKPYIVYNCSLLSLNYLRDEASMIQIGRRENYLPIAEEELFKRNPGLRMADPEEIASHLGCTLDEYLEAKTAAKQKFITSLDQKPYEEHHQNLNHQEEEISEEIAYLRSLSDSERNALMRFSEGQPVGERAVVKVREHIKVLSAMRGIDLFEDL